jgi:hypothetical protein
MNERSSIARLEDYYLGCRFLQGRAVRFRLQGRSAGKHGRPQLLMGPETQTVRQDLVRGSTFAPLF